MHQSKIIITALLALLVLLGGVYVRQKHKSSPASTLLPDQPTAPIPPNDTPIDTSNWKTYRNEEYGFEMKYPQEWSVDEERSSGNEIVFRTLIPESREAMYVQKNIKNLMEDDWVRVNQKEHQGVILSERSFQFSGVVAHEIETGEFGQKYIIFIKNKNLYRITTMGMMEKYGILNTISFYK